MTNRIVLGDLWDCLGPERGQLEPWLCRQGISFKGKLRSSKSEISVNTVKLFLSENPPIAEGIRSLEGLLVSLKKVAKGCDISLELANSWAHNGLKACGTRGKATHLFKRSDVLEFLARTPELLRKWQQSEKTCYLSIGEIMKLCGVSARCIAHWISKYGLKVVTFPPTKMQLISHDSLISFLELRRKKLLKLISGETSRSSDVVLRVEIDAAQRVTNPERSNLLIFPNWLLKHADPARIADRVDFNLRLCKILGVAPSTVAKWFQDVGQKTKCASHCRPLSLYLRVLRLKQKAVPEEIARLSPSILVVGDFQSEMPILVTEGQMQILAEDNCVSEVLFHKAEDMLTACVQIGAYNPAFAVLTNAISESEILQLTRHIRKHHVGMKIVVESRDNWGFMDVGQFDFLVQKKISRDIVSWTFTELSDAN